ncbi:hypothetical protein OHS70_02185 [Streptomyces sp. NBC_00390]|uniref:hypothetical protein n=1 Tax=Streptomyces sp. NBC_00390 TaxID=2975736 RepID=UPI002E211EAA
MDLESVADELYGLPPDEFVEARGRHAAAARRARDRELADRIGALRRPTQSAWTSNMFVRAHPEQVARMLQLGEGLRQAHQELDPGQLRTLSRQKHTVVGELARQARQLAADTGHPIGEAAQLELEATLHAALADPQAAQAWASGRLAKPLSATGFPAIPVTAPLPTAPRATTAAPSAPQRSSAGGGNGATAATAEEQRRAQLTQARQDADAADRRAREREDDLEQAETLVREAQEHAAAVAGELSDAQERARAARSALDEARHRATEAGRRARQARRDARTARSRAERLAADGD